MLKMRVIHLKFIERHSDYQAGYQYSFAMRHVERKMIMKNYSAGAAPILKSSFRKPCGGLYFYYLSGDILVNYF